MILLLVDDHAVVRAGLRRILEDEIDAAEIHEAGDAVSALEHVRNKPVDVVVLDISLPGPGGLEILKEIRVDAPNLPVLMMTMYSEDQYALRAFRAGASGYVTKDSPPAELVHAVLKVSAGGRYVSPGMAEKLAASLSTLDGLPLHDQLSDRELEVLRRFGGGKTVKQISRELAVSEKTISTYRTRMLDKMKMQTTAELIRYAIRAGLVD